MYVEKPTVAQMVRFGPDVTAKDGIHPNEWGYAAWAHHRGRVHAMARTEADGAAETRGKRRERGEGEGKRRREVLAGDADG